MSTNANGATGGTDDYRTKIETTIRRLCEHCGLRSEDAGDLVHHEQMMEQLIEGWRAKFAATVVTKNVDDVRRMIQVWPWYVRHVGEIERVVEGESEHDAADASEAMGAMGRDGVVGSVRDVEYALYQLIKESIMSMERSINELYGVVVDAMVGVEGFGLDAEPWNATTRRGVLALAAQSVGLVRHVVGGMGGRRYDGVNVDETGEDGYTTLQRAVRHCDVELVRTLLQHGADVNKADSDGATALWYASGRLDDTADGAAVFNMVLAAARGDVDGRDGQHRPLIEAVKYGRTQRLQALLAAGASVDVMDREGMKPIQLAAQSGNVEILREVVVAGGDCEAENRYYERPLHIAARSRLDGRSGVIDFLVDEMGVDVTARDLDGWTAIDRLNAAGRPVPASLAAAAAAAAVVRV